VEKISPPQTFDNITIIIQTTKQANFKDAKVHSVTSNIHKIFDNITIVTQTPKQANFKDAKVHSVTSNIHTPGLFENIKVSVQN
jgi:hypothetical protein